MKLAQTQVVDLRVAGERRINRESESRGRGIRAIDVAAIRQNRDCRAL
jgi:hypothetical protein